MKPTHRHTGTGERVELIALADMVPTGRPVAVFLLATGVVLAMPTPAFYKAYAPDPPPPPVLSHRRAIRRLRKLGVIE